MGRRPGIVSALLVAKSLGLGHSVCTMNLYLLRAWITLFLFLLFVASLSHVFWTIVCSVGKGWGAHFGALRVRASPKRDL